MHNYHFFWSGPFSQWYSSNFFDDAGTLFNTAEQYMMYCKALLFEDYQTAEKIITSKNPAVQKEWGRHVENFDKEIWDQHNMNIVTQGNMYKFQQNENLRKILLGTMNKILVEASPFDRIWGIGYSSEDAMDNQENWGENKLGICLMDVRFKLRSDAK